MAHRGIHSKRHGMTTGESPLQAKSLTTEIKMRAESLRKVCEAFDEVSGDVMVTIETGRTFDLRSV